MTVAAVLTLSTACDSDTEYNTEYQCYFLFDTSIHNASIINTAINPLAPGIFVSVSSGSRNGVLHIYSQLNDGKTNGDDAITTAEETRRSCILGASNGLIIGCSSLNNGALYAFDHQCPNCMKQYGLYKYPLNWTNNGNWVKCAKCERVYDLNNNGFIVEGEKGQKLIRYIATRQGNYLNVHN